MSYMNSGSFAKKIWTTRSVKSLAKNFLLPAMAGQKLFLYNENIPRVINLSFNEKTCFYKCKMCPYSEKKVRNRYRKKSEMDFKTLVNIVGSIPSDSFYSFDISSVGETLEFKQLPEFISYIKKERPLVNIIVSTNAVLLDEKMFIDLAHAGLDNLQVSFFAENAIDHSFITGTNTFDKVSHNLSNACRIKKEYGLRKPFIQTFILETQETVHTSQNFVRKWSGLVDKAFVRPLLKRAMDIKGLTPLYDFDPPKKRRPCMQLWYSTAINSKGDILPCYGYHCHEDSWDINFGNVNDATIQEIWNSPEFAKFRKKHLNLELHDYPTCQRCSSWNDYTGIWECGPGGKYQPAPLRLKDFLTPAQSQRMG